MNVIPTRIPDVLIIEPEVYGDDRGYFYESYNKRKFEDATGVACEFVQDNHSRSSRGVLRGLHYQIQKTQGKLVRVTRGEVYDVVVDIRKSSPTFAQWVGMKLSEQSKQSVWIPEGFAHGFLVLSEIADFFYKTTDYYSPQDERCIKWDDPELSIDWPFDESPVVSDKDRQGSKFNSAELFE